VLVNFYAPWCFWSQKLLPAWTALSERLHAKSYSQSVALLEVDCTVEPAKTLCRNQAIHAFPSIHVYRGTTHAFEPYEYGREESILWLHLVKMAAEAVVARLNDLSAEQRKPYAAQVADISADLKAAMARRTAGLDEDWTEDALTPEEEVAEDQVLLGQIDDAASSILAAKGVSVLAILSHAGHGVEAEARAVKQASNEAELLEALAPRIDRPRNGGISFHTFGATHTAQLWARPLAGAPRYMPAVACPHPQTNIDPAWYTESLTADGEPPPF